MRLGVRATTVLLLLLAGTPVTRLNLAARYVMLMEEQGFKRSVKQCKDKFSSLQAAFRLVNGAASSGMENWFSMDPAERKKLPTLPKWYTQELHEALSSAEGKRPLTTAPGASDDLG